MRQDEFEQHARDFLDRVYEVLVTKGRDYAEDDDHFANFNEVAKEAGTTAKQAWFQGFVKHYKRVNKWVRGGTVSSESLEDSLIDEIAYLCLLHGHWTDTKGYDIAPGRAIVVDPYYPPSSIYRLRTTESGTRIYTNEIHEEDL